MNSTKPFGKKRKNAEPQTIGNNSTGARYFLGSHSFNDSSRLRGRYSLLAKVYHRNPIPRIRRSVEQEPNSQPDLSGLIPRQEFHLCTTRNN
jgi:hypothetical protein